MQTFFAEEEVARLVASSSSCSRASPLGSDKQKTKVRLFLKVVFFHWKYAKILNIFIYVLPQLTNMACYLNLTHFCKAASPYPSRHFYFDEED